MPQTSAVAVDINDSPTGGERTDQIKTTSTRKNISLSQIRPFLEIAIPFFKTDRTAFYSLVGVVILTLIESALNIAFSYVRRDIFDALNEKDEGKFYAKIFLFFCVLAAIVPISVLYNYLRLKLALYWRKELTARVLDKYYANRTFYIIECCKDIDNPDQRICEDLTEFTSTSLDFFFILLDAVINLVSFSAILFQIYPMLFVAIIVYALMGTFISFQLGRSLVSQYYDKLQREADFRFGLIRTRENAEGIAFYDSEASLEQVNLWKLFNKAIQTQLGIIRTQRTLEMFTTSYDYLVFVIPYLVVAPLYFSGKLNLGSITQSSEAFYYVRSDFSIIVNYFEKLSAFSAGIDRLSTFIHRINQGGWQSNSLDNEGIYMFIYTSLCLYMFAYVYM
jgi:putative ATP-binding cassette transporter